MGIIRILLAISVVVMHCSPELSQSFLVGGRYAVKLFFIISGFYMAMVLSEKYHRPGSVWLFYGNRLLRLLPTYYLVIGASLFLPWALGALLHRPLNLGQLAVWQQHEASLPEGVRNFLIGIQASPVGQEIGFMAALDVPHRTVVPQMAGGPLLQLFNFLLIPPAWSISLELQFYALAPWLVRRSIPLLTILAAISGSLYLVLPRVHEGSLSFLVHYTLLTELALFILGILAYRLMAWIRSQPNESTIHRATPLVHGAGLVLLVAYPWLGQAWRDTAVAIAFAVCVPWIFLSTAKTRWDRAIGELSYPFYLAHWLLMRTVYAVLGAGRLDRLPSFVGPILVIVVGIVAAALIHYLVERPIDRHRQARLRKPRPGNAATAV